ncbi:hypothetical protein DIPPA_13693 [Diplonema papillatum]|nr:hypothetical protein DIPPA_13693 [Diplonema papillatum]
MEADEQDEERKIAAWLDERDEWVRDLLPEAHPMPSQIFNTAKMENNLMKKGTVVAVYRPQSASFRIATVAKRAPPEEERIELQWLKGEKKRRHDGSMRFSLGPPATTTRADCIMDVQVAVELPGRSEGTPVYILDGISEARLLRICNEYPKQLSYRAQLLQSKAPSRGKDVAAGSLYSLLVNRTKFPSSAYDRDLLTCATSELVALKGVPAFNGMLAKKCIPKNYYLGEYRGTVYPSYAAALERKKGKVGTYLFSVQTRDDDVSRGDESVALIIDAEDPGSSSWVRYINAAEESSRDPSPAVDAAPGMQNCEFVQFDHRVFLRTLRNVCFPFSFVTLWHHKAQ